MSGTRIAIGQKISTLDDTAVNLIKHKDTSGDMAEHIQAKHQILGSAYRIYSGGDIYSELKIRLEKNEFIYTPYLGVAYALADIEYIGEFEEESGDDNYIDTIVPVYGNLVVDIQQSKSVHKELVPYRMDTKRGTIETVHIFYSEYQKSKGLWIQENGDVLITRVGDEGVAWFETW